MKLQQISSQETITQQVITEMINRATVLEFAEFYSITGNSDFTRKSATATGGQFRAPNNDYPANVVTPDYAQPVLKILGDKVQVDRAYERRGLDVASVRAMELLNFARNLGKQFQWHFFNGDTSVDPKEFNGLKKIIPNAQKITAAQNGLSVTLGNSDAAKASQQRFMEMLNNLIQSIDGGAQVMFANAAAISRLNTIARELVSWQINEFGKAIPYYNGIPIRDAGYSRSGQLVIPQNETVGTSNDCTSIYAVRFGEGADLSLTTNIGLEVKDLGLVGVHYTHSVEFDVDLVLLNNLAVARLEGIRLP